MAKNKNENETTPVMQISSKAPDVGKGKHVLHHAKVVGNGRLRRHGPWYVTRWTSRWAWAVLQGKIINNNNDILYSTGIRQDNIWLLNQLSL